MRNTNQMFDDLTSMIASHLYTSQTTEIKTDSIQANFEKNNISSLNNLQSIQGCRISIPSFCDLLSNNDCLNQIVTQKVTETIKFYIIF